MLAALLGGATMVAGCSAPNGTGGIVAGGGQAAVVAPTPPDVTISPSDRAAEVPLDAPVTVSSSTGSLSTVVVTRVDGAPVPGAFSPDQKTWTATDGLDPAASYQVSVTAAGVAGTHTSALATFATISNVTGRLLTDATPADGDTVGVAEPIDLTFNTPIARAQQPEIIKHLKVVSTPAQVGAWHWFSDTVLHYRPAEYWQTGTKVTVTANFHGVNAGNGVWGMAGWSQSFTVGAKHVSILSDVTHQMQVYENDKLIDTWPISMGKPGFETLSGNLIVLYKVDKVKMKSCQTFGGAACVPGSANYYNDYVYYDTAISTNGFFIHSAPWSVGDQGARDVSHGCVNLSEAHASTFYNWSLPGDVVQVSPTVNVADINNGEADWQTPFAQYDNTGVTATAVTPNSATPAGA